MGRTKDRENPERSRDPIQEDVRQGMQAPESGAEPQVAEEPEDDGIRDLLSRLGDKADAPAHAARPWRALWSAIAGALTVLVLAAAGTGAAVLLGETGTWGRGQNPPARTTGGLPNVGATQPIAPETVPPRLSSPVTIPVAQVAEAASAPLDSPVAVAFQMAETARSTAVPGAVTTTGGLGSEAATTGAPVEGKTAQSGRATGVDGQPGTVSAAGLTETEIAGQLARAESMLKNGDVSAARLFFQRIADAGDARGALGMARTYDAVFLGKLPVHGLRPDPAAAQRWYDRARAMGAR